MSWKRCMVQGNIHCTTSHPPSERGSQKLQGHEHAGRRPAPVNRPSISGTSDTTNENCAATPISGDRMNEIDHLRIDVSVVIPVFNAEGTIGTLAERLVDVFGRDHSLQIVLVNDGSADRTHEVCAGLVDKFLGTVSYIRLAKNFGEHNAVMAGVPPAGGGGG